MDEIDALAETISATKEPSGELTLRSPKGDTEKAAPPKPYEAGPLQLANDFERKGLLGEGGLGKVELFWQSSLRREVAVKSVRDDQVSAETVSSLLDEARITGGLEHPGILPVHALLQNAEGLPGFAMKRADGVSWYDLLHQTAPDKEDRLQRHIEIISQLCNTLHYAHSRGFLHRDIKPRNVIVGDFGEVYLLDWGLALPWMLDGGKGLFGTLQYMAPEMIRPELPLGPHTDVYLLGACLHEVLTGEPPHKGASVQELLSSILSVDPRVYPPATPHELGQICQRAMHPDPSLRYQSTEGLRQALRAFLQHRGSDRLANSAPRENLLSSLSDPKSDDAQRRRLFVECRFALEQALVQWPENEQAKSKLAECIEAMFRYELRLKNLIGAEALFAEMSAPPEGSREALDAMKSEANKEKAQLKELEYQFNPNASQKPRSLIALSGAFFFMLITAVLLWLGSGVVLQNRVLLFALPLSFLVVFCFLLFILRRSLLLNLLNKYMMSLILIIDSLMVLNRGFGVFSGTPIGYILSIDFLLVMGVLAIFSITVSKWFWRLVALNALVLIPANIYPEHSFLLLSISLELSFLWAFLSNNKYATSYQSQLMQGKAQTES